MSIDARIRAVVPNADGTADILLEPREGKAGSPAGQSRMTVLNPPAHFDAVVGTCIWGGDGFVMVNDTRWADRIGYTKLKLVAVLVALLFAGAGPAWGQVQVQPPTLPLFSPPPLGYRPAVLPVPATALSQHVVDILFLRTKKQVRRVDARRVIAAVENEQTIGYRPHHQFVGNPVGAESIFIRPARAKGAVTVLSVNRPGPQYATGFSFLADAFEKSVSERHTRSDILATARAILSPCLFPSDNATLDLEWPVADFAWPNGTASLRRPSLGETLKGAETAFTRRNAAGLRLDGCAAYLARLGGGSKMQGHAGPPVKVQCAGAAC